MVSSGSGKHWLAEAVSYLPRQADKFFVAPLGGIARDVTQNAAEFVLGKARSSNVAGNRFVQKAYNTLRQADGVPRLTVDTTVAYGALTALALGLAEVFTPGTDVFKEVGKFYDNSPFVASTLTAGGLAALLTATDVAVSKINDAYVNPAIKRVRRNVIEGGVSAALLAIAGIAALVSQAGAPVGPAPGPTSTPTAYRTPTPAYRTPTPFPTSTPQLVVPPTPGASATPKPKDTATPYAPATPTATPTPYVKATPSATTTPPTAIPAATAAPSQTATPAPTQRPASTSTPIPTPTPAFPDLEALASGSGYAVLEDGVRAVYNQPGCQNLLLAYMNIQDGKNLVAAMDRTPEFKAIVTSRNSISYVLAETRGTVGDSVTRDYIVVMSELGKDITAKVFVLSAPLIRNYVQTDLTKIKPSVDQAIANYQALRAQGKR